MDATTRSKVPSRTEARASLIALVRALVSDVLGSTLRVHLVRQAAVDPRIRVYVEVARAHGDIPRQELVDLAASFRCTVGIEDIVRVRHPVASVGFKVVFLQSTEGGAS